MSVVIFNDLVWFNIDINIDCFNVVMMSNNMLVLCVCVL